MSLELNLRFPDKDHVIVSLDGSELKSLPFVGPLTAKDRQDIQWYLEVYGAHSLGDPDDEDARRIVTQLPAWGKALFDAVFRDRATARLFNAFQDSEDEGRLLTITAEHPAILALPWELLHDPAPGGTFLFHETPRISIRRRVAGATGGRPAFKAQAKDRLHLLFVVSRPEGAGFLDPRADAQAVLDALERHAPGCFTWEFLRPATIDGLVERLEDKTQTPVDILHFDGHGVFDRHGGLPERAEESKDVLEQILSGQLLKEKKEKEEKVDGAAQSPPNTGYLLFEKPDGPPDLVSAQRLGENLHRHKVALVILSACQTAALGDNDEPMGCVAARLTAAGIPAVVAMTHSVLVHTTRALFGAFYKELAQGRGIGESLDNARRYLKNNPQKYEVVRCKPETGPEREPLILYDWFLPALYQGGADLPLLKKSGTGVSPVNKSSAGVPPAFPPPRTNVRSRPESGFFGRRRELWDIERWFADKTRRITITGFGGQGKTALAEEAGRWLTRAGMFRAAAIVRYNEIPGADALAVAVGNIGAVLGESLLDAQAAEVALRKTPTLLILDNLEAVAPEPLRQLLDAAVGWSEAGGSRVLCTTRKPDFGHPSYRVEGTRIHRRIVLKGLGRREVPEDALEWFAELTKLPPPPAVELPRRQKLREVLMDLFDRVRFHPHSIRVLAQQLKTRSPDELSRRLDELLSGRDADSEAAANEDTPACLIASLQLSLDQLDEAARRVLPRLGVFQGGAMEPNLLAITEIGKEVWPALRRQLEAAALIEAEPLPGVEVKTLPGMNVPFLRFHPTLAPLLWGELSADERAGLTAAHRREYHALAAYLYESDNRTPHEARAIAFRELPNLLCAVHAALDAGDPESVAFATCVNRFLGHFGLNKESEALVAKTQAVAGETGSQTWFLAQSNQGEQLYNAGRVMEAAEVFRAVLGKLGNAPTYERAVTLGNLGRCFGDGGRPDLAAQHARDAITILEQLEQTDLVKRQRGVYLTELADALVGQGRYAGARKAYNDGLEVVEELGDLRAQGVSLGQLGTLAMREGKLNEALDRHRAALALFQQLQEPAVEAGAWHNLGIVFEEARQWDEAERHYRESARIREQQGLLGGTNRAAATWGSLAIVSEHAGRPEAAEMWYRKTIEGGRKTDDRVGLAKSLSNLANLLQELPGRLAEARQLAEEALTIKKTLDPGATEIWKTYGLLAEIAEKEAETASDGRLKAGLQTNAREYRRLARDAKRNFAGTRHELRQLAPLIHAVVDACTGQPEARQAVTKHQQQMSQAGAELQPLSRALDRILAGERDENTLCEGLHPNHAMIIETVLHALSDPSTLKDLLPDEQ